MAFDDYLSTAFANKQVRILHFLQCKALQEYPSICSTYMFRNVLFLKNLIVPYHSDNTFLF